MSNPSRSYQHRKIQRWGQFPENPGGHSQLYAAHNADRAVIASTRGTRAIIMKAALSVYA